MLKKILLKLGLIFNKKEEYSDDCENFKDLLERRDLLFSNLSCPSKLYYNNEQEMLKDLLEIDYRISNLTKGYD